ncbi:hypothetical protein Moror_5426 [Moniliophthora roreri MCA 2997]|uniref:Uncharacterized protein n=2 Tax=Moniliophthora roreri TaxID=221103 RepID=V2WP41_MONRO|nr:hypothetical protein Moror_5426 [Moniliophthora roreri MCA 2997]
MWNDSLVLKEMSEDCLTVEFPAPVPKPEFSPPVVQAPAEWEVALTAREEQLLDWKHFWSTYEQIKKWLREQWKAKEWEHVERAVREKAEKEKEEEQH